MSSAHSSEKTPTLLVPLSQDYISDSIAMHTSGASICCQFATIYHPLPSNGAPASRTNPLETIYCSKLPPKEWPRRAWRECASMICWSAAKMSLAYMSVDVANVMQGNRGFQDPPCPRKENGYEEYRLKRSRAGSS
jgi:hypothetical protein